MPPAHGATAKPVPGRWRQWYSTLHPSLQLIGLQLWMPLFFIIMFCLCYVAAFHAPAPHNVPVGVVGGGAQLQSDVAESLGDAVELVPFEAVGPAKDAVLRGQVAVAVDVPTGTTYVAGAHQFQVASLLPVMLTPVLAGEGITTTTTDLAPLPPWDAFGTVSLYLTLAWCIGGYMIAMFIGLMGAPLRHRTRMSVIVAGGLLIAVLTNLLAGPIIGAVHGHFWQLTLTAWGWIVAIGLAVNGLSYFFGRFIALPAMVVFVFLSVPSSGAAYPAWFMPQPFAWLNNVVVGSGITEMLKRELYDVGPGYSRGLIMMCSYAAGGLVLMYFGKKHWENRRIRRILTGQTTMFADAQKANREFLAEEREDVLERHGLESTETGTLSAVRNRAGSDVTGLEDDRGGMFLNSPTGLESGDLEPGRDEGSRKAR